MVLYQDKSRSIPNKYGPNIPDKRGREDKTDILRVRKGQEKGGLEAFICSSSVLKQEKRRNPHVLKSLY